MPGRNSDTDWSNRELLRVFGQIRDARAINVKYCLFVDGIDEYDGDHFDISLVLKELAASPNFKLCVSSRPWNVFKDAFGGDGKRMIHIHDLTYHDVQNYVQSQLAIYDLWREPNFTKEQMESTVTTVAERAHGVFLWVFLVTKLLRNGLVNGDTFRDLQRALNSFPTKLEPFFKQMLEGVSPLHTDNMAHILRIAVNAKQPLSLKIYHALVYEEDDKDYALNKSRNMLTPIYPPSSELLPSPRTIISKKPTDTWLLVVTKSSRSHSVMTTSTRSVLIESMFLAVSLTSFAQCHIVGRPVVAVR